MNQIKCLFFDDDPGHLRDFSRWIKDVLLDLYPYADPEVHSTDKLEEIVLELEKPYQLFITDILVGSGETRTTIEQIVKARKKWENNIAIVAITQGTAKYFELAANAGADRQVSKSQLLVDGKIDSLKSAISESLQEHDLEPAPLAEEIFIDEPREYALAVLLETIGKRQILKGLYGVHKRKYKKVKAHYIKAGLSGAAVLRISATYEYDTEKDRTDNLLLKISRDRAALVDELNSNKSEFPTGLFIDFQASGEHNRNQNNNRLMPFDLGNRWYCIASEYKDESFTFLEWINKEVPVLEANRILNELFLDKDRGLKYTYQETAKRVKGNVLETMFKSMLSGSRHARIILSLEDLGALARKHSPPTIFDEKILRDFLISKRVSDLSSGDFPDEIFVSITHGDLHSKNIIVSHTPRAFLIDPASISELHWAADTARLLIDLLMSSWDLGDKSYEWDEMDTWVKLAQGIMRNDFRGLYDKRNQTTFGAIKWLRSHAQKIYGSLYQEWEFQLVLGIELLRSAYRQDITAPKRTLGLVAACDALAVTSETFKATR